MLRTYDRYAPTHGRVFLVGRKPINARDYRLFLRYYRWATTECYAYALRLLRRRRMGRIQASSRKANRRTRA